MEIYGSLSAFGNKKSDYGNHPLPQNHVHENIKIPPGFKILIIDDDHDFLKALEYRLTKKRIEVVAVASGYDAIKLLEEEYFDLILLDLRMPGMDGVETFKKIKRLEAQPFVVIMTAFSEDEQIESAKKLKPFGFIKKPFDLYDLMPYIKKRVKEETHGN